MERYSFLKVSMNGRSVGTLALYQGRLAAFEYSAEWLGGGFAVSPFSLPLEKKVFIPKFDPFDGLFGVFADSLPDGWGRLLVDRLLLREGLDPETINPLNRLAIVDDSGMGALSYRPVHTFQTKTASLEYDRLAEQCRLILEREHADNLDELFRLGGSSGGARPKILTKIDGEDWILKFASSMDSADSGLMEYRYAQCAARCGVEMPPTKLFSSSRCAGYFGVRRFDRAGKAAQRIHMLSVSAILETSHRIPNLDYHILMKLTLELTKSYAEVEKLFRLMCFNVFAHNRDDHSKNFSFLYDAQAENWKLAPAYDLTWSSSIGGEHATCVNGNGKAPGLPDILAVAEKIGLERGEARKTAENIRDRVAEDLGELLAKKV